MPSFLSACSSPRVRETRLRSRVKPVCLAIMRSGDQQKSGRSLERPIQRINTIGTRSRNLSDPLAPIPAPESDEIGGQVRSNVAAGLVLEVYGGEERSCHGKWSYICQDAASKGPPRHPAGFFCVPRFFHGVSG